MAFDYDKYVNESFKQLGPKNPLRSLSASDRRVLTSVIDVYLHVTPKDVYNRVYEQWETAAEIAEEAAKLGRRIKTSLFEGQLAEELGPLLRGARQLPAFLEAFSIFRGQIVDNSVGKRGHKGKIARNNFLVAASELVLCWTGKHHDEHLAELIQVIGADRDDLTDISGDSIRKKREHLKKTYRSSMKRPWS